MRTPLIAVVSRRSGRLGPGGASYTLSEHYVQALRRAGGRPALLTSPDQGPPEEILERFDGLIIPGGGDVEPHRYGARPHPKQYGVDGDQDALEIGLCRAADRLGLPTLAICRGIQLVNVAFGGTLHQHLWELPGLDRHSPTGDETVLHDVKVSESSRLAAACGATVMTCVSHHHQGIDRLGEGLIPVAWSGDGLVEAVERADRWFVAVQWHPEESAAEDQAQQAIFDGFVQEARADRLG